MNPVRRILGDRYSQNNAKRVKLQNGNWYIEVENNKAYIYSSEDAKDPWTIIEQKGEQ